MPEIPTYIVNQIISSIKMPARRYANNPKSVYDLVKIVKNMWNYVKLEKRKMALEWVMAMIKQKKAAF